MNPKSAEVLVIGGGLAGMTAANRCRQLGLPVVVSEKGTGAHYLCNSRFATGVFHISYHDVMDDHNFLEVIIDDATSGTAHHGQKQAISRNGSRLVRWLQAEGAQLIKSGPAEWQRWVLAPPIPRHAGANWPGRAGDVLLRRLSDNLAARGGVFYDGTRVKSLKPGPGGIRWLAELDIAGESSTLTAQHVICADGGFQGSPSLVEQHIGVKPGEYIQRGAGTGGGDCLTMAATLGAARSSLNRFYGHVLSVSAHANDRLWPFPWIDELATSGIVVDPKGERFLDEGMGGVYIANELTQSKSPASAFAVFDKHIWEAAGRDGVIPANPLIVQHGAKMWTAPSVEELARMIGASVEVLGEAISSYNRAVQSGATGMLSPVRTASKHPPCTIAEPPFFAVPICAGITYTMGGIVIDGHARVVDTKEAPIPGLYAAGACTGGLEGGGDVGYVGGLVKAGIFGLLAAETIAAGR